MKLGSFNFFLGSCKISNLSQPGFNGALFGNFSGGKSLGKFAKKREWKTEIAAIKMLFDVVKSCPNKKDFAVSGLNYFLFS